MLPLRDLLAHVQDHINDKPAAKVVRAANLVLDAMARDLAPIRRGTLTTGAPTTAGTVAVAQDSSSLTGTGTAFGQGHEDAVIRVEGRETWWTVDRVGSATSLTLSSAWPEAGGSGLTYELIQPWVNFPRDVLRPLNIRLEERHELRRTSWAETGPQGWSALLARPRSGPPTHFVQGDFVASDGSMRIQLHPWPDQRYVLTYNYRARPRHYDARNESASPDFPDWYDDALIYGTLHILWDQEDTQTRAAYWLGRFQQALQDIRAENASNIVGRLRRASPTGSAVGAIWEGHIT